MTLRKFNAVIVIATYNEAGSIRGILDALVEYPVILVDDASPDGTVNIARQYKNVDIIVRPEKAGVASAYLEGFGCAVNRGKYDFIVQMNAGPEYDPNDIFRLLEHAFDFRSIASLTMGSRFEYEGGNFTGWRKRDYFSYAVTWVMGLIGVRTQDATCGVCVWDASVLHRILRQGAIKTVHASFMLELLFNAVEYGVSVHSIPITYKRPQSDLTLERVLGAIKVLVWLTWRRIGA